MQPAGLETNVSCADLPGDRSSCVARPTLWLVDENEEFRSGFGHLLESAYGFKDIQHFGHAEAAVMSMRTGLRPDAILLDIKSPGMKGVEAIKVFKKLSPDTRVIMFATYYDLASAKESLAAGASRFLTKHHLYEDVVAALCEGGRTQTSPV